MNCLKCKTDLKEDISFIKKIFGYYKVYNFFCCSCDYERVKEIKISKEFYFNSINENVLKIQNTKTLLTDKTYNQNYNKMGGLD